jgi:chromosome segregation ATPase
MDDCERIVQGLQAEKVGLEDKLEKAQERAQDQERLINEYGTNNKKLLDESDALRKDVQAWKELATGYSDDVKTLKTQVAELEDDLKSALIKPASELAKGQIISVIFDAGTIETISNALQNNADTLLIEYYEGTPSRAVAIHI